MFVVQTVHCTNTFVLVTHAMLMNSRPWQRNYFSSSSYAISMTQCMSYCQELFWQISILLVVISASLYKCSTCVASTSLLCDKIYYIVTIDGLYGNASWKHICYVWLMCFSTDSMHSYGYKLWSSSRRRVPSFVWGILHIGPLKMTERISIIQCWCYRNIPLL